MPAIRLLFCLLLATPAAWAGRLEIPLRVPIEAVQKSLAAQLPASPNAIYREGPCRYLNLDAPVLGAANGELSLATPGSAAIGAELFGRCQNAADWQGTLHARLVPQIDADGRLRLRIVDSRLEDSRGRRGVPLVWKLARDQVHPRLEGFSYDLGTSRNALLSVLRSAAPSLANLQLLQPRVEADPHRRSAGDRDPRRLAGIRGHGRERPFGASRAAHRSRARGAGPRASAMGRVPRLRHQAGCARQR
jgi:hypothetical protein